LFLLIYYDILHDILILYYLLLLSYNEYTYILMYYYYLIIYELLLDRSTYIVTDDKDIIQSHYTWYNITLYINTIDIIYYY